MAKESLGYVELEWICPNCGGRNPGRATVCGNCGAAQPADVKFEKAGEDKLVTDAAGLAAAKAGPDVHCPFCGTRNPANATTCSRCGGDLTGAEKRESGQILGAKEDTAKPLVCDSCGTENPPSALKCQNCGALLHKPATPALEAMPATAATPAGAGISPVMIIIGVVVALALCGAMAFFFMRGSQTETTTGAVADAYWERTQVILAPLPVNREAWQEQVPGGALNVSCSERERGRSQFPTGNSEEVCGTPYVVDQGSGFGEVVQDCEYIVYDNYCSYTVIAVMPLRTVAESGHGDPPRWPNPQLESDQKLGDRSERYQIVFDLDGKQVTMTTNDPNEYLRYPIGSEWQVEVNGFGSIVSVEPAP